LFNNKIIKYTIIIFKLVAIADWNGKIKVYDERAKNLVSFQAHSHAIFRIKLLPNGFVATCSDDYTVKIWNPLNNNWNLIQTYTGKSLLFLNLLRIVSFLSVA